MSKQITPAILREATIYLSAHGDYDKVPYRSPFMCHTVALAGGDVKAFEGLLIECGAMDAHDCIMRTWDHSPEDWENYVLDRQSIRFMLLHLLAEMLESEAT
jgi:hypothetical protein